MDTIITTIIVVFLICLSGIFSGLNLGLMTLNPFELKRQIRLGNKYAKKIYPLRKKGNLLLCTILLGNVAVNSILAIFLAGITTGLVAGITSTALIVVFGEIIPQATFSKHALKLGSKTAWIIWLFLYILFPITKPLSMILDKILGKEIPRAYTKKEISLLAEDQEKIKHSDIDIDDLEIIKKGLIFSDKTVKQVMTYKAKVQFIERTTYLTKEILNQIRTTGHSRIPVYDLTKDKMIGILYTKDLIGLNPHPPKIVTKIMRKQIVRIKDTEKLDDVLKKFQKDRIHIFIVLNKNNKYVGIITLEDILEEVFGEIWDEYD
ncbi:hemolysin family protein [Candidatus Woesearchaeota archaeon]|nr:hemolysin family protein [Candidatus Woesearchaeota archaeon]MCF8013008.1 hemolysin family protein [Candidatus Woesearchaeota archaeon]